MSDFIRLHKSHFNLNEFIAASFREDVGDGDHTSLSTIPATHKGKMRLIVKEDGVLAGVEAACYVIRYCDPKAKIKILIRDGASVKKGDIAFTVSGNTRALLQSERLLLNIMQRMSAIATKTRDYQKLCEGTKARVIDTRKTTPGFRFFEKWAVVIGGGANHRYGLFDMILIKDNHVDFAGGVAEAIDAANNYLRKKKKKLPIEIETRSLVDVKTVLQKGGVDRIMLDNFTPAETKKAVELIGGKYKVESSGGITEKNIRSYALCGVDFISIGALTHHVKSLDISFKAF
jgi:nicotinate-nucleotide pyrophosphorylase (carboxylating)